MKLESLLNMNVLSIRIFSITSLHSPLISPIQVITTILAACGSQTWLVIFKTLRTNNNNNNKFIVRTYGRTKERRRIEAQKDSKRITKGCQEESSNLSFCYPFVISLPTVCYRCYHLAILSLCYPLAIRSGFSPQGFRKRRQLSNSLKVDISTRYCTTFTSLWVAHYFISIGMKLASFFWKPCSSGEDCYVNAGRPWYTFQLMKRTAGGGWARLVNSFKTSRKLNKAGQIRGTLYQLYTFGAHEILWRKKPEDWFFKFLGTSQYIVTVLQGVHKILWFFSKI